MQIVIATRNQGKISEISNLLNKLDPDIQILGLDSFPRIRKISEPGSTFEENALHKARTVCNFTSMVSLADDSGLEVDALNGEPGVYSARYSGEKATDEQNNEKLLSRMNALPKGQRTARFRCVLAAIAPNGNYILARGQWEGFIALSPRGTHGFGYDPIFVDSVSKMTAAEMDQQTKNSKSHRSQALHNLLKQWPGFIQKV